MKLMLEMKKNRTVFKWYIHLTKITICLHYNDVIMGAMASQITRLTIVYSTLYSGADQRKHQGSASLAFVRGIHRWPVNSPHKWPVMRKMSPFDDVIIICYICRCELNLGVDPADITLGLRLRLHQALCSKPFKLWVGWPVLPSLQWRHNEHDGVSNHQPHECLLNRLFRRRSKKTSKLCVTGLCAGNSPETGEFPAQMASNAENVSIWWRHHDSCG